MKNQKQKVQYKLALWSLLILFGSFFTSCHFFSSITEENNDNIINIDSLVLGKSSLAMPVGSMDYISVHVKPQTVQKDVLFVWAYDEQIIQCDTSSNWGVTITALKEGQTSLKCSYNGYDATCLITVAGYSEGYEETTEPYIYSNTTVLQTSPGITEKIFVSLYGGDASDIDGYTWTIDNSSVATIQPTGQYCMITAKDAGYARIKITHTKASYPYYIGVYVFSDPTNVTYITTANNIITMNKEDSAKEVMVNLVNGKDSSLDKDFSWEIIKEEGTDDVPVGISFNGNNAIITPMNSGSCTVRVTHPDSTYPLDILCRVITIVKNVYILPNSTLISINGDEQRTITCSLQNIKDGEYSIDEYEYKLDDYNVAEITNYIGNQVTVKGKANGSCKLLITHPKSAYTREVLLIVTGQLTDALDASCYITTSQNYVRTKVGADTTKITISLKGGDDGDETDFIWNVKSTATDGISDVIKLETTNGTALHSRAATMSYAYGEAYITPNAEGTAVISISHPKILYPTEILIKVLSKDAVLTEPLYFTGNGLIRILNGESADYTVELKGKNKSVSDDENIKWTAEDSRLSIAASGNVAQITAPNYGTGSTMSYIIISHEKCDFDKKVLVMTADDQETLSSMKVLYSDKLYYNIEVEDTAILMANQVGFTGTYDEETETSDSYDFSIAKWTVKNPAICSVEKTSVNPLNAIVKGLKSGTTTVTVSVEDVSCDFTITVYPTGTVATEPEIYFTTSQNVVSLSSAGKTAYVYASAVNLSSFEYSNITWTSDNEDIVTVIGNGTNATITANAEGTAIISVSHKDSQNVLKIYVRVGSEYVVQETEPIVYISTTDVITMLKDSQTQQLKAVLVNYFESDTSGFSFSIDNENVAEISAQTENGIAYIKPVSSGQAEITISHTKTNLTKKVLVLVGNSEEELASLVYLTTTQNVVSVSEGSTKAVSVSIKNSDEIIIDGYTWTSSNPSIVDVTANGATAVLNGNGVGTAIITITNKACKYPLTIIAQCVNPIAATANPYIQLTSSVLTLTVGTTFTNVTADLVGGTEMDYSDFSWATNDSSVCVVYGQNEVGKLRALKEGQTYITVNHPKAGIPAQILVVCEKKVESECYISVPNSIITMKPTDSSQTITAQLINGVTNDKYNFTWSLDVYDVIDFQYSANICTITPKQSGSCTITIKHPKAHEQQIIVNVQEYSSFSFPTTNTTITQGTASFVNMQVPTTKVTTHVEYSVDNAKICSISGTKSVAQIQGIESGTTTVRAKLVASSTGVVQAESEMMVYVKEKATDAVYITAGTTIYTVQKGKSQTLSASLSGTGITVSDSQNLKWTTSDSDIIQVTGINSSGTVSGSQIYITALKSGEALITCTHEKATSALQFYVVVPGSAEKVITLNKTFVTIQKGSSGTTIKANIENAESSSDYYDIIWTCEDVSGKGETIAKVMGSGQNVTIYPVKAGEAKLIAQLPDVKKVATCTVKVEESKGFTFEQNSKKVQPFHSAKVKYTVSPADAILTWTTTQDDDYFEYSDLGANSDGVGYLQIDGIKEGSGAIYCVTDGGAKGTVTVKVSWDYSFSIDTQKISAKPGDTISMSYKVSPADANISINGMEDVFLSSIKKDNVDSGTGVITFKALKEGGTNTITVRATNPNSKNEEIGSFSIKAISQYGNLTITPSVISKVALSNGQVAHYSRLTNDNGILYIGDGEKVTLQLSCKESGAVPTYSFSGSNTLQNGMTIEGHLDAGQFTINSCTDITNPCYKIETGYVPTYNGSTTYPDGKKISVYDFDTWSAENTGNSNKDWSWEDEWCYPHFYIFNNKMASDSLAFEKYFGSTNVAHFNPWHDENPKLEVKPAELEDKGQWGRQRDSSLDGKTISVEDFEKSLWYYIPVINQYYKWGHYYGGATIVSNGQINTKNISAKYYECSPDTTVTGTVEVGTIKIAVSHNGKNDTPLSIRVILEKRDCLCTHK